MIFILLFSFNLIVKNIFRILVSETYSISDIYKYISGTNPSEISNNITSYSLSPQASVNPTFSSDGTNIILTSPNSTNLWQRGDLSFLNNLDNFKISITTSPNRVSLELNNNNKLYIFTGGSFADTYVNSATWSNPSIGTLDSSKEYIYEMIVNGTNVNLKVYETDGTVIINTSKTISASMTRFGLAWSKNNTFKFKDLKVELL